MNRIYANLASDVIAELLVKQGYVHNGAADVGWSDMLDSIKAIAEDDDYVFLPENQIIVYLQLFGVNDGDLERGFHGAIHKAILGTYEAHSDYEKTTALYWHNVSLISQLSDIAKSMDIINEYMKSIIPNVIPENITIVNENE